MPQKWKSSIGASKHDLSRIPVGVPEDPRNELVGYREEDSKLA